jgi:hypothetical protein
MMRILLSISFSIALISAVFASVATATVVPGVKISLVQAAGSDVKYERIDVLNMGDATVDITGWKLLYKSASGATTVPLLQFQAATNWHVMLDPAVYESVLSKEYVATTPADSPLRQAEQFTAALNHTAGSVQLLDTTGQVVDMVGWGTTATAAVYQGSPAPAMTATTWLRRHSTTGNNGIDFILEPQQTDIAPRVGVVYEVQDICANMTGIQIKAPDGYQVAGDGSCAPIDVCPNLPDIQLLLPGGMTYDADGNCQPIDICGNIAGLQTDVPPGYELTKPGMCEALLPVRAVMITELLPNPSGADAGNEFIELYNADIEPVSLDNYRLAIGDKQYMFPVGVVIAPGAYWTASDTDMGATLANTTGQAIYLLTVRGVEVASVPAYANAPDDASWALIDGVWQYSYAPTPAAANQVQREPACQLGYERDDATGRCRKLVAAAQLAPCAEGQYRSEVTGRCRAVVAPAVVAPCKEGQYRSEATGRCRSFTTASVGGSKSCADDQFRNPLTNRCKAIASNEDVALVDCGEGRERNPETHRCRNIVTASVPSAAFAPVPIKETAKGFVGWWALGGVGILAAGYGVWEWRRELAALMLRASAFIGKR